MPQTILQVANSALLKIGARQIATLGEATKEAEVVNARIRSIRDMALRSHTWTYFRKSAALTSSVSTILPWSYTYTLPTDCLRILRLHINDSYTLVREYEIIGPLIYTSSSPVRILYVRQPASAAEATDTYPDDFSEAWSSYLAAEISTAIFDSPERRQLWLTQYEAVLRQARFTGAVEQADSAIVASDQWLESRTSGLTDDRSIRGLDAPSGGL